MRCCAKWLSHDFDKVEEAMAQTLEKAYNAFLKEIGSIENMFAWLCRIAHNICMDIHRFYTKQLEIVNQVSRSPDLFYFADNQSGSLENEHETRVFYSTLVTEIDNLPLELKQVLQYKFVYDLDYEEIATQLQLTQENVRKRVSLARKQLKQLRSEYFA